MLTRKYRLLDQPKHLLVPFLPVSAVLILLVLFQGDAGTAVVMAFIAAGMLWVVGAPLRVLMALTSAGVVGVVAIFRLAGADAPSRCVSRPESRSERRQ